MFNTRLPCPLTVEFIAGPSALEFKTDGSFSFTPSQRGNSDFSFNYRISDGQTTTDATAIVTNYWFLAPPISIVPYVNSTREDTTLSVPAPGLTSFVILSPCFTPPNPQIIAANVVSKFGGSVSIRDDGSFSYTPLANFEGTDEFEYVAIADEERPNDVSNMLRSTATINVTPVNDAPTFSAGPSQLVLDTSVLQVINAWAKNISPGSEGPVQTVHFEITTDNPALFSTQPKLDATGKLVFRPATDANGVAHVSVVAVDDGGTANGGIDTSPPQSFTIGVSLAKPLHNRTIATDVTHDGKVLPDDVMDVINFINASGPSPVPKAKPDDPRPAFYYDVTGDNFIAADDVIAIINYINARPAAEQESGDLGTAELSEADEVLLTLLAADTALQPKRRMP